jgi:hypothetical protein
MLVHLYRSITGHEPQLWPAAIPVELPGEHCFHFIHG